MDVQTHNLPDTQNNEEVIYSQPSEDDFPVAWGMLFSTRLNFKSLELLKDEYTIGRAPNCDVILTLNQVKHAEVLTTFSKLHCRIKREGRSVYLEDMSFNGSFVNGDIVGRGKKVMLQNNDQIGLASKNYKVFVFMDPSTYMSQNYPDDIKRHFVVSHILGTGACGEVRLVFGKKTCQRFAMKIIQKKKLSNGIKNSMNDPEKIMNEVRILKALRHPCIIRVYEIVDTPNVLYIILELMEGGELFDRILNRKQLAENEAKIIFYQIVLAVEHLHNEGIAHRDLKPENVLLASDKQETLVKISDFGLSKFFDSQMIMTTFCGTPMYVAPEILKTRGKGCYTNQVDVWSLGVILYVCLSGRTPFLNDHREMSLADQIMSGTYYFPPKFFRGVSPVAIDLIKLMLTVDPEKRITIDQITSHAWLQDEVVRKQVENLISEPADENEPPHKRLRMECNEN